MKKIKSLILLTMLSGAVIMSSCKKDKSTPTPFITATIDGSAVNFNTHAVAIKGSGETAGVTVIQGEGPNGTTFSISLLTALTAGKTFVSGGDDVNNAPLLQYSTSDDDFFNDDDDASNVITVTITSVSSTSVQGTFKGKIMDAIEVGNGTPKTKLISNGKFNVTFTN